MNLINSGRGKGLATFYRINKFAVTRNFYDENLQITVLESEGLSVVTLYRSNLDTNIVRLFTDIIPKLGNCLVIGDFNICSRTAANHPALDLLRQKGFNLLVSEATHFGGGALDQAWLRTDTKDQVSSIQTYSPYFNAQDHDAILFTFAQKEEKGNYLLAL